MHVVIFENSRWASMAPLSLSRPVFAMSSGAGLLVDRQLRNLRPSRVTLWCRPELAAWCESELAPTLSKRLNCAVVVNQPLDDAPALLIDGATIFFTVTPGQSAQVLPEAPPRMREASVGIDRLSILAGASPDGSAMLHRAYVFAPGLNAADALKQSARWNDLLELPKLEGAARIAHWPWDLITANSEALTEDFAALYLESASRPKLGGPYHLVNEDNIWGGAGVSIAPGAVLDASRGPIMLAEGASIDANAVVKGPCFIGSHTQVKPLATIHAGTSLGPVCKVGGEISNAIVIGYSNKGHEGYLGDSYLGEWVNLGAGTTTSNLKNTYGEVKIRIGSREIRTGKGHLGSLIGDHSKTAIGTRLMTGSYIGYSSMIAASGLPPVFVGSFSFITDRGREAYRLDKAFEVMRAVYGRRQKEMGAMEETRARYVAGVAGEVEA